MKRLLSISILTMVLALVLCSCSTVVVEKHVSLANGGLSATDGNQIYFVQEDGIYVAEMDMSNPKLLVQRSNITQIAANDKYIAYSAYQDSPVQSFEMNDLNVVVLSKPSMTVVQQYPYYMCYSLYLVDECLYVAGLSTSVANDLGASVGLNIMNFTQSDDIIHVTQDDCSIMASSDHMVRDLYYYEDDNVSFSTTYESGAMQDGVLYSKEQEHIISRLWDTSRYQPLTSLKEGSLLTVNYGRLGRLVNKEFECLFTPNENGRGKQVKIRDYQFMRNDKLLIYGQCNQPDVYPTEDKPLSEHIFDAVYILDANYQLEKTYTTKTRQMILHADENRVVVLDGRTVRSVDYEREELETLGQIAPYGNALQVEVCGSYLLFFSGGKLISHVSIA